MAPKPGQHIRKAGEDVAAGATVLRAGQVVTPAVLGLVAALGLGELTVTPRQRVLVVSTGSELVSAGTALQPGQIYESNAIMLAAAVREAGGDVVTMATTGDDVRQFSAAIEAHAGEADLIITSGGVSAGAYEVVKDAFGGRPEDGGGVEFVKVAMQPGMPQGAGTVAGIPIVTLPGNPVSALVSFGSSSGPALRAAMGLDPHRRRRTAVLAEDLTSPRGKRQFRRGVYDASAGTVTSYGPRPRTICAGWPRRTACSRFPRRSPNSARVNTSESGTCPDRFGTPNRRITRVARRPDLPVQSGPKHLAELIRSTVPPVHRAGLPFISAGSPSPHWEGGIAGCATPRLAAAAANAGFFRHPPRTPPTRAGVVVAPADGLVCLIEDAAPPAELGWAPVRCRGSASSCPCSAPRPARPGRRRRAVGGASSGQFPFRRPGGRK